MTEYTYEFETQLIDWAQAKQSSKRFAHTQRVVETVTTLAERWSPDNIMPLRLAGWIHDSAKHKDPEKLLRYALKYGLEVSPSEENNPSLLHGVVAYWKANKQFQLHDDIIRTACTYHTVGNPAMTLTDKLFFLADLIEPERDFPMVDVLRDLAMTDVDRAMLVAVDGTLRYLLSRKKVIDPRVLLLYNALITEGVT